MHGRNQRARVDYVMEALNLTHVRDAEQQMIVHLNDLLSNVQHRSEALADQYHAQQQKITFDGELGFPDLVLFKRIPESQEKRTIFELSGSIPIPGASIGPIEIHLPSLHSYTS